MGLPSFIMRLLSARLEGPSRGRRARRSRATRLALELLEDRVVPSGGGTGGGTGNPGGPQIGFPDTTAQETFNWYMINELRQNPRGTISFLENLARAGEAGNGPAYAQVIWNNGLSGSGDGWLNQLDGVLNQWIAQNTTDGIPATRAPLVMSTVMVNQARVHSQFMIAHDVWAHSSTLNNSTQYAGFNNGKYFGDPFNGGASGWGENMGSGPQDGIYSDSTWRDIVNGFYDVAGFMLDWGNAPNPPKEPYGFGHLLNLLARDPADGLGPYVQGPNNTVTPKDITGFMVANQIGVGVAQMPSTTGQSGVHDQVLQATDMESGSGTHPLANYTITHQVIYRSGNPYITGIVFRDEPIYDSSGNFVAQPDGYYEPGEGLFSEVFATNTATGQKYSTEALADEGYALQVPPGNYDVTIDAVTSPATDFTYGSDDVAYVVPVQVQRTNITVGNVNVWHPVMLGSSLGLALTDGAGLSAATNDGANDGSMNTATNLGNATQANPLSGTTPVLTISSPTDVDWYTFGLTGRATNQDSFSIYFDGSQGSLELGLYDAQGTLLRTGTTGTNVDTINLGGLGSAIYYVKVDGFHGASNFYTATYALAPTAGNPIFNQPNQGPFTIAEGQDLNLDLSATDPDGGGLTYQLTSTPATSATIVPTGGTGGQFSWEPPPGSAGQTYTFTATANNFQRTSSLSFKVTVTSGAPNIARADATPDSVSDAGTETITVTAHDVTTGVGQIAYVEFWLDLVGNGVLDTNKDRFLFQADSYTGNHDYSWTGALLGVSPGTTNVLVRAVRFSYSNTYYSPTAVVPVLITHATLPPDVAVPNGGENAMIADNGSNQSGSSLITDSAGNLYALWNRQQSNGFGGFTETAVLTPCNAQGQPTGNPVALTAGYNESILAAVMTDATHFDALLQGTAGLTVGRFTTAGAFLEQTTPITSSFARRANLAVDKNGDIVVVWDSGGYLNEFVNAQWIAPNLFLQGSPVLIDQLPQGNSGDGPAARDPVVAFEPNGNFVVVWSQLVFPPTGPSQSTLVGREFSGASITALGDTFVIATDLGTDLPANIAINGNDVWLAAWTSQSQGKLEARRYRGTTPLDAQPFQVNTTISTQDLYPQAVIDDGGWFAVTWASDGQDPGDLSYDAGTYAQLFDASGQKAGPEFRVPVTTAGSQSPVQMVLDGNHTLAVLWNSGPSITNDVTPYLRTYQVNFPPVLATTFAPLITLYGVPIKYTAAATDADYPVETMTYALEGNIPAGAKIDATKGTFTWTPNFAQAGKVYDFFIQVQDSDTPSRTTTQAIQIDVRKGDHPPVFAAITPAPISYTRRDTVTVPFQAHDADGDAMTYSAAAVAYVAAAAKTTTVSVPATVANGTVQIDLSGLPASDLLGRIGVTLSAADWYTTTRTTFTILATNFAPVIQPYSPQKVQHDSGAITLPLQGTDPDGNALTYSAAVYAVSATVPVTGPAATVSFNAAAGTWSILPAAGFVGTFKVRLTASDGVNQTTTSVPVSVVNLPSTLVVSDQAMAPTAGTVQIALQAINPDNDPQTFTASAVVFSPAYQLQQQYGLMTPAGSYATGSHGANEKNLTSHSGTPFFILPDGTVYRWGGAIVTSTLVGRLDPSYYADPTRLTKAQPVAATPVQTSISGSTVTVTPPTGFTGYIRVTATVSDGVSQDAKSFTLRVGDVAPTFPALGAQTMALSGGPRTIALAASDPDGDAVTYSAQLINPGFTLEQELGLTAPVSGHPDNQHGWGEKYLLGKNGQLYFILPTGQFYLWTGSIVGSRLITVLDPWFYADVTRITNAVNPAQLPATVSIAPQANTLTIDPHGFTGRLYVQVSASDGFWITTQAFAVTVTAS